MDVMMDVMMYETRDAVLLNQQIVLVVLFLFST